MSARPPPGFIIAGTHSGVGKTTASFALMAALTDAGFVVQPFKIGPDFIDPGYHRISTGRVSINLDRWMMGFRQIRSTLGRHAQSADVAVVEGMGALYDGENASGRGSAADFARRLALPVLLVVDVWGMTRSTGAVLNGFGAFEAKTNIRAVLLNRAGSRRHFEMVRDALPSKWRDRVVGYLPADDRLAVPERHLGLLTVEENHAVASVRDAIAGTARQTVDLDRLIQLFAIERRDRPAPRRAAVTPRARVGVARDRAFCFYYQENLRELEQAGAELVPFSPISDDRLPEDVHGLYIGGGYPESFASTLAANARLLREIRAFGERGGPIYGECGGLMYLGRSLTDFDGSRHDLVSLLPVDTEMDRAYLAIRYVDVETTRPSPLGPASTRARGQEFHQSRVRGSPARGDLYQGRDSAGQPVRDGFTHKLVVGSYVHLYFSSNRRIAAHFVDRCVTAARDSGP